MSSDELPATIQSIIDAEEHGVVTQPTVVHEVVFAYDGNVIATFESTGSIQLPAEGATITLHHHEVTITGVDLDYAVIDGVQHVTAEVEVGPA
ncbi:hypothetical protein [Streptomyces qinglanensis]|uniref:hypothetical protein n=1 Tax=Streptomyces qinglanensis TaxID=943816 RepID=UPI003D7180EA